MHSKTKLSDFEFEVLQALWRMKEASTPELHEVIRQNRDVGYSTVRTIVDRLEQKGAIKRSERRGRAITFAPILKQSKVSRALVQSLLDRVFGGEPKPLFSHLLEHESLDEDDIVYLESLLAQRKSELGRKE